MEEKETKTSVSYELTNSDGTRFTARERQVANGYIICIDIYKPDNKGCYDDCYKTMEFISKSSLMTKKENNIQNSIMNQLKGLGYE